MRRVETVWSQIEASLKQIEIGEMEVECFKSFKRQEEMAASWKKNLKKEVIKQKETEQNLQARYGNLLSTLEKAEEIMVGFRAQALKQADVEDSHKRRVNNPVRDHNLLDLVPKNVLDRFAEILKRFLLLFSRWWSCGNWNH